MFRKRDREAADPACAAMDEDRLAALELQRLLERDHGREPGERDRGALHVREPLGLARDDRFANRESLGVGAFARHFANAEYLVARFEVRVTLDDHAGEVAPGHMRKRDRRAVLP
jgi:hypothetical protein